MQKAPAGHRWSSCRRRAAHPSCRADYEGAGRLRQAVNPHDFSDRFPLIVASIKALPARSCVVGEAIACDEKGLSVFEMIRWRQHDAAVNLCAFDLLQLDGEDLRREPIEVRKATLKGLLRRTRPGIAFNRHFEVDGVVVYEQACALGCEA